jgi:hypothetical protein
MGVDEIDSWWADSPFVRAESFEGDVLQFCESKIGVESNAATESFVLSERGNRFVVLGVRRRELKGELSDGAESV